MQPQTERILGVTVENFTCFGRAELAFARGLNVFIGENGTGKSHVLKLLYATLRGVDSDEDARRTDRTRNKVEAETHLADRLMGVFRPDSLGRLARRVPGRSTARVSVTLAIDAGGDDLEALQVDYDLSSHARKKVKAVTALPEVDTWSLYLPTREVISFYPGFLGLYERHTIEFDETYRDLCLALSTVEIRRGRRDASTQELVSELESRLGARITVEDDRFYVKSDAGKIEAHLVAEGLRKLATVMYLALNGSLTQSTVLFWDEPEASLNPRYVTILADMLHTLADWGVQVFIASHDYLLTQKLSLAAERAKAGENRSRFFLFRHGDDGVEVEAAPTLLDLSENPIADEFSEHYADEIGAALDGP